MGFLDGILGGVKNSVTSTVSSTVSSAANSTARNVTNKALNPKTYSGLNPKAIADKTTFFVRKDGNGVDVYLDNQLVQNIAPSYIEELKNKPEAVARADLANKLGVMRQEFKNPEVGKLLVQKFIDAVGLKF